MASTLRGALLLASLMGVGACFSSTDNVGDGFGFAGDWCTPRTLSTTGTPLVGSAHLSGLFLQEGNRVRGSGAVKLPGDTILWPSRYVGDIAGNTLLMEVEPLEEDPDAPRIALDLQLDGANDLVGTAGGAPGFTGTFRLVRLGPRCFAQ